MRAVVRGRITEKKQNVVEQERTTEQKKMNSGDRRGALLKAAGAARRHKPILHTKRRDRQLNAASEWLTELDRTGRTACFYSRWEQARAW